MRLIVPIFALLMTLPSFAWALCPGADDCHCPWFNTICQAPSYWPTDPIELCKLDCEVGYCASDAQMNDMCEASYARQAQFGCDVPVDQEIFDDMCDDATVEYWDCTSRCQNHDPF